ncbi:AraC family transcriptional regulator [Actinoplanes lobatus]|uniref:AraC family transcriptional regulator n=1 Tax=Actinoplanes lobatus TaxID=113568 RepID=A0A7W7HIH0_9ACTN|nr:helix-turn-helix domain-containing protein [Actinoplanes lobatus]MBB4751164.1 AraC-like DNA-binding protein [Actinoplanes lobatus]GGN94657.1 AraC family transcriptional regulator [Actinoplanes lobatus]GIE44659.1 AraC family transcriptional regulator [Actinoplanes lobatus]
MIDVVRTGDLPEAERFDFWRQAVSEAFVPLDASRTGSGAFRGELRGAGLGPIRLYQVDADGHQVRRTSRLIAAEQGDYFKLGLQRHGGSVLAQDGRGAVLRPGDFTVYDTTRPYTFTFGDPGRLLVLIFPRTLLGLSADDVGRLTATRFSGRAGLGALISSFLIRAADVLDDVDVRDNHRLGANVVDLLTTALAGRLDLRPEDPDTVRRALFTRAVAHIDQHLGDAWLAPDQIAAALHISTRYLQKLFQAEGVTVSACVRQRRLEACRHDLLLTARPVSAIASRWGLPDAAHFSRLFRATYGASPREYRRAHTV